MFEKNTHQVSNAATAACAFVFNICEWCSSECNKDQTAQNTQQLDKRMCFHHYHHSNDEERPRNAVSDTDKRVGSAVAEEETAKLEVTSASAYEAVPAHMCLNPLRSQYERPTFHGNNLIWDL